MRAMKDMMNPLDLMQEDELNKKYRPDRNGILDLCRVLHYDLNHPAHRHNPSIVYCCAVASGSFLNVLADSHGVKYNGSFSLYPHDFGVLTDISIFQETSKR